MDVRKLNQNQINELKSTYFYNTENEYTYPEEIPNEVIFGYFCGINFVNDDFACTANQ